MYVKVASGGVVSTQSLLASLAHDAGGYILPWQVHCWTCVQSIKRRIRAQWVLRRGPARVPAS